MERSLTRKALPAALILLIAIAYFTRGWWLPRLADPLIRDDGPAKADVAVVLSGENDDNRILRGAELVRDGYVSKAWVSGPRGPGGHESDHAIAIAVSRGFPSEWFVPVRHAGLSTFEEARILVAEMRRSHIQSFLLVTSNFHTARAGRIFQAQIQASGPKLEMRVIACPDEYFPRDRWWRLKEGRLMFVLEWLKTPGSFMVHQTLVHY